MTSRIGSAITSKVIAKMTAPQGVSAELAALAPPDQTAAGLWRVSQVRARNVAADLVERSSGTEYPAANVYCEKLVNKLTEKFRKFSGTAQMAIEIRYSQDRLEGLQDRLELYTDAVAQTLDGVARRLGRRHVLRRGVRGVVRSGKTWREEFHPAGENHIRY